MADTITSKNLPPIHQPQTGIPEVFIPDNEIVAKPLRAPNFINLRPKNPSMSLFWGNRAVGDKESGLRFDQLIAMGFRPAVPLEILTMEGKACPPSIQKDGRIMYGDLILLIIPRTEYVGQLKWNAENAANRVRRFGSTQSTGGDRGASAPAGSALADLSRNRAAREGKIAAYVPPLAETDSRTADNSGIPANLAEK